MKSLNYLTLGSVVQYVAVVMVALLLPAVTFAQGGLASDNWQGTPLETLLVNILSFSSNILIPFIIGIGFLLFVWGMFQYFIAGGANEDAKDKGKSLIVYALAGFVLIIIFWGLVNLLSASIGLEGESAQNLPGVLGGGAGGAGGAGGGAPFYDYDKGGPQ